MAVTGDMAVTGVAQTAAALQAYYTQNGFLGQSEQKIADLFASMAASGAAITLVLGAS